MPAVQSFDIDPGLKISSAKHRIYTQTDKIIQFIQKLFKLFLYIHENSLNFLPTPLFRTHS